MANFTIGLNEQNQHFAELRQKACLYIHSSLVLIRCLLSFNVKHELFETKKRRKTVSQAWVRKTLIIDYHFYITNTTAVVIRNLKLLVISLGHFASWIPFYC